MKQTNPWGGLYEPNLDAADVVILGIPFDGAVSAGKGAAEAPDRLRDLSRILPATTEEGFLLKGLRVRDEGNVPKNLDWEEYFRQVEEQAFALLSTGKRCLFLGGDHSISIPLEKAYARTCGGESVGIIHFDSHTDIADEFDGHRWSHACVQRRALELLNVKPEGLTFLGIRSYEEEELHFLSEHPEIRVIGAREIFRKGLDSVLAQVYDRYRDYRHIYMTIDIDVLDPAFARHRDAGGRWSQYPGTDRTGARDDHSFTRTGGGHRRGITAAGFIGHNQLGGAQSSIRTIRSLCAG